MPKLNKFLNKIKSTFIYDYFNFEYKHNRKHNRLMHIIEIDFRYYTKKLTSAMMPQRKRRENKYAKK